MLLTSKQYDKAEPFLKRYLTENDDNPNAFLYMGDPLLRNENLCSTLDSSALYYNKAYKGVTEKELRKNDEYYEGYMRRDLRTGKFVIKFSDVQFDIENRIRAVKEKKDRVKLLKNYFDESSSKYTKANSIYRYLQATYGAEKEFFLRSDEAMINQLKSLVFAFDSVVNFFDKYKTVSKEIGKTGYSQLIDLQEIKDMKRDGSKPADFFKDDLKLWDYKEWADKSTDIIVKEINPMRDNLVAYDMEINKLRVKLKTDSVSIKNDLARLADKSLSAQLKKYDPDPMPLDVFAMKIAELAYHSNVILNKPLKDSSNVRLKLGALKTEIQDLKTLDSVAIKLSLRNFENEDKDYHHFISKVFGTLTVLAATISTTQEYAKRERLKKEKEWEATSQLLKWIVDAKDSIPLYIESNRELKHKPVVIEQEKFTFGLTYQDSSISPARITEVKANFPVDQLNFKRRNFQLIKGLDTTDGTGNAYILLLYSTQKTEEKFPATLAKIYRSDGLAWSINFSFEMLPSEIILNKDAGEISVKIANSNGEAKVITFDKNGKLKG